MIRWFPYKSHCKTLQIWRQNSEMPFVVFCRRYPVDPRMCNCADKLTHDGSMVLLYIYGVPWIPSIYPLYVSIYTSTMDPMGNSAACVDFRLLLGSIKSQTTEYHMVKWIPLSTWTFNIYIQFSSAETCTSLQQRQEIVSELLLLEATLCMARSHSGRMSQPKLPTNSTWQSWRYSNQPYGSEMKHPTHKILWSLNFKRLALMLLTLIYYWAWPIISWSHDPALHGIASLLHLDP